jgi:predicted nucleic acid-binding protein
MGAGDKAHFLLIDERRGCTVAADVGLKFIGLLGVLLEGKTKIRRTVD